MKNLQHFFRNGPVKRQFVFETAKAPEQPAFTDVNDIGTKFAAKLDPFVKNFEKYLKEIKDGDAKEKTKNDLAKIRAPFNQRIDDMARNGVLSVATKKIMIDTLNAKQSEAEAKLQVNLRAYYESIMSKKMADKLRTAAKTPPQRKKN